MNTTQTTSGWRQISALYYSTCPCCRARIEPGQIVLWKKGEKARCLSHGEVDAVDVAIEAAKRESNDPNRATFAHGHRGAWSADPSAPRRSRCPNPRDCGDPTCDGSCGYGY